MPRRAATLRRAAPNTPTVQYDDGGAKQRQRRRALPTNSAAWRAIREQQLAREPLCRKHRERGQLVAANEVDHEDGDATNNDPSNLQSLCTSCHSRKTVRENGGFGNRREPRW